MKRLFAIVLFCLLVPSAYGETINYGNGGRYVGDVSNGVPHGQGTYTWADGSKYVGEFKNGKKHGQGTLTFGKGEWEGAKYVGEFKNGKYHGQGTFTYASGNKYVGEWKVDRPWEGIEYFASGLIVRTYSNGKLCNGCTPTKEQLALVASIRGGQNSNSGSSSSASTSTASSSGFVSSGSVYCYRGNPETFYKPSTRRCEDGDRQITWQEYTERRPKTGSTSTASSSSFRLFS